MPHTTIPSEKGQVTIPIQIRKKYKIDKNTPIIIEDKGKGILVMQVMNLAPHDAIAYYENDKEFGLTFQNGIDPQAIVNAIEDIDG